MRAKTILQYLRDNPRFLRTNQSELTRLLRLAERDIVDLTGKQLVSLRDENTVLRRQLGIWYQNAADNELIMFFLHRYAVKLAGSKLTKGGTAKLLGAQMKKILEIPFTRIVPITGPDKIELSNADRRLLTGCEGALRTTLPLESFSSKVGSVKWKVWLYVPMERRRRLFACIVCASNDSKQFPRAAHADYALRMAELTGQALDRE